TVTGNHLKCLGFNVTNQEGFLTSQSSEDLNPSSKPRICHSLSSSMVLPAQSTLLKQTLKPGTDLFASESTHGPSQRPSFGSPLKRRSGINGVRNTQRTPACTVQSTPNGVLSPVIPTPGPANTFQ